MVHVGNINLYQQEMFQENTSTQNNKMFVPNRRRLFMKSNANEPHPNRVGVIGTSASGLQATTKLVSELQPNFPGAAKVIPGKLKQIMGLDIAVIQAMRIPPPNYWLNRP